MADWTIPRHDRLRFDIMSGKINEQFMRKGSAQSGRLFLHTENCEK
nr:MAG TPA: hypothetical protein [Caudoviricetes sp.]